MHAHEFLRSLTCVLAVAAVTTVVFQRLRQPVVLGYLVAGLIATVLAISAAGAPVVVPTGDQRLAAGDVLALAGTRDAPRRARRRRSRLSGSTSFSSRRAARRLGEHRPGLGYRPRREGACCTT